MIKIEKTKILIGVSILIVLVFFVVIVFVPKVFTQGYHISGQAPVQDAYWLQISTNSAFTSIVHDSCPGGPPNGTCQLGTPSYNTSSYAVPAGSLAYGATYYARVMVWDDHGAVSDWQTMTGCVGPGCQPGNTSWRTPAHAAPDPDFSMTPLNPSVGSLATFSETGTTFFGTVTSPPASWSWNFGDGSARIGGTDSTLPFNLAVATHSYGSFGSYPVTLSVEDDLGITCSSTSFVNIIRAIPRWREVAPR